MFKGNDRVFHTSSVFCQLLGTPERFKTSVLVGLLQRAMSGRGSWENVLLLYVLSVVNVDFSLLHLFLLLF